MSRDLTSFLNKQAELENQSARPSAIQKQSFKKTMILVSKSKPLSSFNKRVKVELK